MEQNFSYLDGQRVRLKYKSEFMENYIAESNVDLGQDIKVIDTADQRALIFVINSQSELTLITPTHEKGDAWQNIRISKPGQKVTAFNFLHLEADNQLRIAYGAAQGKNNELHVSGLLDLSLPISPEITASWPLKAYALANRERVLNKISLSSSKVLFCSKKGGTDATYHLLDDQDVISDYILPEHADEVLQISLGNWKNTNGVFILYQVEKERTMLYQSFMRPGKKEIVRSRFQANYLINCFFLLQNTVGNDQLFMAGKGLTRFKDHRSNAEQLCEPVFDFSKIDVAEENGDISVWALNALKKELCLIKSIDGDKNGWSAPVTMHGDTDTFTALRGQHISNHMFLFNQAKGGKLTELWQDAVSGHWHEHLLGISNLSAARLINTYTLDLYFEKRNMEEKIEDKISFKARSNTFIYLNDVKHQLIAGVPFEVDYADSMTIMCPLDSLVFPEIEISSTLFEKDLLLNPAYPVNAALATRINSADDLRKARKQNGELLVPKTVSLDLVASAAQLTGNLTGTSPYIGAQAVQANVAFGFWDNISNGLQDLLFSVKKGFVKVKNFMVEKAAEGWRFILDIGGKIYDWIGNALTDVLSFLERVWEKIGVFFKDMVDYLSFLFSWNDILESKEALKYTANLAIDGLKPGVEELKNVLVLKVKEWRVRAKMAFKNIGNLDYDVKHLPDEKINGHQDKIDSRTNWVGSKQNLIFSTSTASSNGLDRDKIAAMDAASDDPTSTKLANLLKKFMASEISLGELIKSFADIMLDVAFELLEDVVNSLFDFLLKSIDLIKDMLNGEIQIPLLSAIYRKISGAELSMLDFCCLIAAIPMTIGYKIAFGEAPFAQVTKTEFANYSLKPLNLI